MRNIAKLALSAVAIAAVAAPLAACSFDNGPTVTGKQQCTYQGKPAYCVSTTQSRGGWVYIPYQLWLHARVGDSYTYSRGLVTSVTDGSGNDYGIGGDGHVTTTHVDTGVFGGDGGGEGHGDGGGGHGGGGR